jgi:hypothetical protein
MAQQLTLPKTNAERKAALLKTQQECCFYCRIRFNISDARGSQHPQDATIDHFIPLSRGGAKGWSNRVLSCRRCNGRKGNRLPMAEEMERWNALRISWPHLPCLDLNFAYKKRCCHCHEWINPIRLKQSIDSRGETRTCSERCRRKLKTRGSSEVEATRSQGSVLASPHDRHLPSHHYRTERTSRALASGEGHVKLQFGNTPTAQGFSRCSRQFLGLLVKILKWFEAP